MKKLLASTGWIMILLPLLSIAGVRTVSPLAGNLRDTEERNVHSFTKISSSGGFDVTVKMGNKESLRLEGDKEQLDKIETVVSNGELKIRYKRSSESFFRDNKEKVRIYITAKTLHAVALSGSGNLDVEGTIKADRFTSQVSGSGSATFNVNTSEFKAMLSGSGKIKATGSAKNSNVAVSGSGEFDGDQLRTEEVDVKVSGSGEAFIYAEDSLSAAVSGSGDVFYKGNARVDSKISGSGGVKKM